MGATSGLEELRISSELKIVVLGEELLQKKLPQQGFVKVEYHSFSLDVILLL